MRCQRALAAWPQPCGRLTTPAPHFVADGHRHFATVIVVFEHGQFAVAHARTLGIARMHQQHAPWAARDESRDVVHPGVVAAQLAAADQSARRRRPAARRATRPARRRLAIAPARRGASCLSVCNTRWAMPGCIGPRSMPCGARLSFFRFSPWDQGRKPIAVGAQANEQVDRRVGRPMPADTPRQAI